MEYYIAIVKSLKYCHKSNTWEKYGRLYFVFLRPENEAVSLYESNNDGQNWKRSTQVDENDRLWRHPIDNSTCENYRASISGLAIFKDLEDIKKFCKENLRASEIELIQVDKNVFDILDGSQYHWAVEEIITNPSMDLCASLHFKSWEDVGLVLARYERLTFLQSAPKCKEAIAKWLREVVKAPEPIIAHLLP